MSLTVEDFSIPGVPIGEENPFPFFRKRDHDIHPAIADGMTKEKRDGFGREASFRVLPYRMQDSYSRDRRTMRLKRIALENNYLRAEFLPELGGRLYALTDKTTGKDILYRNPVFQPANLAIRNAWFSGGIEWNIAQSGHTFTTCSPVFAAGVRDGDGDIFLRIYEFERCKRLFWKIDFHLPDESRELYVHVQVVNPSPHEVPMYWWTNMAVREKGARIFAPADEVIFINHDPESGKAIYGLGKMPRLESANGKDASYPEAFHCSSEYFFQIHQQIRTPWEAAVYPDGNVLFDVSSGMLRYRKMFCWGMSTGGRNWQSYLSKPGEAYVEMQAGLAPTQLHGCIMPPSAVWQWTQAIGNFRTEAAYAHGDDWYAARSAIQNDIFKRLPEDTLAAFHEKFSGDTSITPSELLHSGAGWGALELERMRSAGEESKLTGYLFPASSLGREQYPWICLLKKNALPEMDEKAPPSWMVQDEWRLLLERSLRRPQNRSWSALLHYGVMLYEAGRESDAVAAWKQALESHPSVWLYRNLAVAERDAGNPEKAESYYREALELGGGRFQKPLVEEYFSWLLSRKEYSGVWAHYLTLPAALAQEERIELAAGTAAIELGHLEFAARLFTRPYASVREGEMLLTDLWYKYMAIEIARQRGVALSPELVRECREKLVPPAGIDFRTHNG